MTRIAITERPARRNFDGDQKAGMWIVGTTRPLALT
jgi:hypothetical protein